MSAATASVPVMIASPPSLGRACSIREIRLLHRRPDSECPLPGDTVEVAGRVYLVVAETGGPEVDSAEDVRGGYVHVREALVD